MSTTPAIDFRPAGAAAPAAQRVRAHAITEATLTVRNGEQLLLALVIPVGLLVAGRVLSGNYGLSEETIAPSVFALAIWSTCFTSLAIATGFERRYGVLERLAATPLGRTGLLAGKAIGVTLIALAQLAVLVVVALALGWRPHPTLSQTLVLLIGLPLAMVVFALIALAMAGALRAEATLALANLIYLAGLVGGGIMWPVSSFPASMQWVVRALPTGAMGEISRHWSAGDHTTWWALGVLAAWLVVLGAIARKLFRWTS